MSYEDSGARQNRDRKSWEFRHSKFLRGRPELLKEIRRKTYSDTSACPAPRPMAAYVCERGLDPRFDCPLPLHPDSTSKAEIEELKTDVKTLKDTLGELRETMNNMSLVLMRALGGHANPFVGISTSFQTLEGTTPTNSMAQWGAQGGPPGPMEAFGAMTRTAQPPADDPVMPGGTADATLPPSPGASQQPNKRRRTRAGTAAGSAAEPGGGGGSFPVRGTSSDVMRPLSAVSALPDSGAGDEDDLGSFLDGFMNDDVLGAALAGGPLDPSASMLGMGPGVAPWTSAGGTSAAAAASGRPPALTIPGSVMPGYRGGMPAPDPSIGAPVVPTPPAAVPAPSVAAAAAAASTASAASGPVVQ